MNPITDTKSPAWASSQIDHYKTLRPRFKGFAEALREILEKAAARRAPYAIVEARAKDIASFAEKIQRKKTKYNNPVHQLTDLCGARVTTYTEEEKEAVCQFVREHFEIDWANSEDEMHRLGDTKFGYRSTHFIVQFKRGVFPTPEINATPAGDLFPLSAEPRNPMKAEIQVRTLLEHAWANFTHDRAYKAAFTPPPSLKRELNAVSATLEAADAAFTRALTRLRLYGESYAYLTRRKAEEEVALLKVALLAEDDVAKRSAVALRIARLAHAAGLWRHIIEIVVPRLDEFAQQPESMALRMEAGYAFCRERQQNSAEWAQGQSLLQEAAELTSLQLPLPRLNGTPRDRVASEASALLAWSYAGDPKQRRLVAALYLRALEGEPHNPYHLADHLIYELAHREQWSHLASMRAALEQAIATCHDHIRVRVCRPCVYFTLGFLHLFLARPRDLGDGQPRGASSPRRNDLYAGLGALARGVQACEGIEPIDDALQAVELLHASVSGSQGEKNWETRMLEWTTSLLTCGKLVKLEALVRSIPAATVEAEKELKECERLLQTNESEDARQAVATANEKLQSLSTLKAAWEADIHRVRAVLQRLQSKETRTAKLLSSPLLIVCGGTAAEVQEAMEQYRPALRSTLKQFSGTVVSGGTVAGIPGILGSIAAELGATKRFRLVGYLPNAQLDHATEDSRYDPPFIRTSDHDFSPAQPLQNWIDMLALGIQPSHVTVLGINGGALAEFEYRLGLGLGAKTALLRKSGRAADDVLADEDLAEERDLISISDLSTLEALIVHAEKSEFREQLGRRVHESYLAQQTQDRLRKEPNLADWTKLRPDLQESNCQQADSIRARLFAFGYTMIPAGTGEPIAAFLPEEIEALARLEHARWNAERLREGWKHGPEKDVGKKISPALVSWEELPENIREYDRQAVQVWPQLLREAGLEIVRVAHPTDA